MKAIVYEGPNKVNMKSIQSPQTTEGYTLVKTAYAGICGTDLNIFVGAHPRAKAPLVLGHEFSGVVESGNPKFSKGTKVTVNPLLSCGECNPCLQGKSHVCESLKLVGIDSDGGMSDFVNVPNHCIVALPEMVSLKKGALSEPIAVAVHAIRQGGYTAGDSAVVFGAGTIGLCVAYCLKHFGCTDLTIIETNSKRIDKAHELGFRTINPVVQNVSEEINEWTKGQGADIVFDCAGHPSVLLHLTDIVKVKGQIVVVAAYKKPAEINLLQGMFKELSIQFVRVYTPTDFDIAPNILAQNEEIDRIITHVYPPEQAAQGFDDLINQTGAVKVLFEFNQ